MEQKVESADATELIDQQKSAKDRKETELKIEPMEVEVTISPDDRPIQPMGSGGINTFGGMA